MNIRKVTLNFSGRKLAEFPKEVFETKRLAKLDLSNNEIKSIPKEIGRLKYLETLNLSSNHIRIIYANLFDLPRLKIVILNDNKIVNIPKQIGKLSRLKILHLANNQIPIIPAELARLESLEELNLTGNQINNLPLEESSFINLKALWLANNPLQNLTTVNLLNNLKNLRAVYCYSPKLGNTIKCPDKGILASSALKGNCLQQLKEYDGLQVKGKAKKLIEDHLQKIKLSGMKKEVGKIFISYSHEDKEYLPQLKKHLKVLGYDVDLDIWDDTRIRSSDKWKEAIEKALDAATIAILLVSTDFLASNFIRNNELPQLLEAAEKKGTKIHPVIIHPCRFIQTKSLSQFQAVNDPSEALSECDRPKQDRIWMKLCNDIQSYLE